MYTYLVCTVRFIGSIEDQHPVALGIVTIEDANSFYGETYTALQSTSS